MEYAEDEDGEPLGEPFKFVFATGEIPTGSISGRMFLPRDLPVAQRVIESPAVVELFRITDGIKEARPFRSFPTRSGVFNLEHIPDGEFALGGLVEVGLPKGLRPGRANEASNRQGPTVPDELADRVNEGGFDKDEGSKRFEFRSVPKGFDRIEFFGYNSESGDGHDVITVASGSSTEDLEIHLRPVKQRRDDALEVVQTIPMAGDVVELETEISLTFNAALFQRGKYVAIEARLIPKAVSGRLGESFLLSEDAATITWPVQLKSGKRYRLIVSFAEGAEGRSLADPFELRFATAGDPDDESEDGEEVAVGYGDVSGTVTLNEGIIDAAEVFLYTRSGDEIEIAGVAIVDIETGAYLISEVEAGEYRAYAELRTAAGEELLQPYDADGNGDPDPVIVTDGQETTGIDIATEVFVIDADEVAFTAGADSNETVSLDLSRDVGNNRRNALSGLSVGDTVGVHVYVQDLKDVVGFGFTMSYDPEQMEYLFTTSATPNESNFLASNGGTPVFLPAQLEETTVLYGGGILGATTAAAFGEGLLAAVWFKVKEGFTGAIFSLDESVFKGLNYTDRITIPVTAAALPALDQVQQVKGPVSFDFDETDEDQGQLNRGFLDPGTEFTVAVYLNGITDLSGVTDLTNFGVAVQYEPDQLTYIGFSSRSATEVNFLASQNGNLLSLPPLTGAASVEFGAALLAATTDEAPDGQGPVGFLTFETNDDFTQSDLIITQYSLNTLDTDQLTFSTAMIGRVASGEVDLSIPAGAINQIQTPGASGESDFSGDGRIDLGDFFALADVFGRDAVDDLVKYDLDRNGMIGLGDFFIFADAFGSTLSKTVEPEEAEFAGSMDVEVTMDESGLALRASPRVEAEYDRFAFIVSFSPDLLQQRPHSGAVRPLSLELSTGQLLVSGEKNGSGTVSFDWVGDPDLSLAEHLVPTIEMGAVRALDGSVSSLQPTRAVVRALPTVFQLGQNYPNPFNPATTIHYQLPIAGRVRVDIFDLLGQRVRTLVNEMKPAGFYSIGWKGDDDGGRAVASGVYFYRLEIDSFTDIKKLMLVK